MVGTLMNRTPAAVLLAGVTGSGKTTLARELVAHGFLRLSVDEEVFLAHGRYGIDYPEDGYFELEADAVSTVRGRAMAELAAGHDIVLDHGLWTHSERRLWRDLALSAGAIPVLVHLHLEYEEALARLELRNCREDANALRVTPEALHDFFARFEAPGPGEKALSCGHDPAGLVRRINQLRDAS